MNIFRSRGSLELNKDTSHDKPFHPNLAYYKKILCDLSVIMHHDILLKRFIIVGGFLK